MPAAREPGEPATYMGEEWRERELQWRRGEVEVEREEALPVKGGEQEEIRGVVEVEEAEEEEAEAVEEEGGFIMRREVRRSTKAVACFSICSAVALPRSMSSSLMLASVCISDLGSTAVSILVAVVVFTTGAVHAVESICICAGAV